MIIKTLNSSEMAEVFKESGFEECEEIRFLCWDNIYESLTIRPGEEEKNIFFCAFDGNTLIGVAKLKTGGVSYLRYPSFYNWLSFLSIKKDYQNQGVSKKLIDELFSFIEKEKLDHLLISGYTRAGFNFLKDNLRKKAAELGLKFQDEDKIYFA